MESAPAPRSEGTPLDTLFRFGWLVVGPGVIAVLLTTIVQSGRWFDVRNLALAVCIAAVIVVRWWEFSRGTSRTADGEPATQTHVVRFTAIWIFVGVAAWAAANGFANLSSAN